MPHEKGSIERSSSKTRVVLHDKSNKTGSTDEQVGMTFRVQKNATLVIPEEKITIIQL